MACIAQVKPEFHLARHVSTWHVRRVKPVELVVSSRSVRHRQHAWARYVERVVSCRHVTWRAKWNLGFKQQRQRRLQSQRIPAGLSLSWNSGSLNVFNPSCMANDRIQVKCDYKKTISKLSMVGRGSEVESPNITYAQKCGILCVEVDLSSTFPLL